MRTKVGPLAMAVVTGLFLHSVIHWVDAPPVRASTQNFQLNQIESSLRGIENRLSRIESMGLTRGGIDTSAARLARIESSLASVESWDSNLARIETRLATLSSGDAQLARIDARLAGIEADLTTVVGEVCRDSENC